MRHPRRILLALLLLAVAASVVAHAKPLTKRKFARAYPAAKGTKIDACATCHLGTGVELNPYGEDLLEAKGTFASIEKEDSDGDGATNIDEIKALTFPGDGKDVPGGAEGDAADSTAVKAGTEKEGGAAPAKSDSSGKAKPDSSKTGSDAKDPKKIDGKDEDAKEKEKDMPRGPWLPFRPGFTLESGAI